MNIRICLFFLLISCFGLLCSAQAIKIRLNHTFGAKKLILGDSLKYSKDSIPIQIETLKYYLSTFQFFKNNQLVLEEKNNFHLIDASNQNSLSIEIKNPNKIDFDELRYELGIDSITNVSGVLGGDLDPVKGMYWTWQSGYINFKLEGSSSVCKTRNNEFQFHLGGYLHPFYSLQPIRLKAKTNQLVNIELDIESVLDKIYLNSQNQIMSPSADAVFLSKIVANSFIIKNK